MREKAEQMKTIDLQLGPLTHASCFKCKYFADIDKFDWRKNVISKTDTLELIQLVIICPVCRDENCEGLYPNEVN